MYENVYTKLPRDSQHQTDTDSVFANKKDIDEFKQKYPHMLGSGFGQLEIEPYLFETFYAIRPKVYAGIGKDEKNTKFRNKGVSKNATIVKEWDNEFIETIKDNFYIKWELHEDKDTDKLKNNVEYVYEELVNDRCVYIIQSTFNKCGLDGIVKNAKKQIGI